MQTSRRVLSFLGLLLLLTRAQAAEVQAPASPELHAVRTLFGQGRNDELIEAATAALAKMPQPDPNMLYWRGYAERRIARFDAAAADLDGLGDFTGWPKFPTAATLADEVHAMLELRPPNQHLVERDGKVLFRVYCGQYDAFAQSVISALPRGYQTASKVLGREVDETPIFIFDEKEYPRFFKFCTVLRGAEPRPTWRVLSHSGTIMVSQREGTGAVFTASEPRLPRLLAHEMTHAIMTRTTGHTGDFPNWFNEGLGEYVASTLEPAMLTQNDRIMKWLVQKGTLLSLKEISSPGSFHDALIPTKEGVITAGPYSQGFSMTRYLAALLKDKPMSEFVTLIDRKASFQKALTEATGLTSDEFYAGWLKSITLAQSVTPQ